MADLTSQIQELGPFGAKLDDIGTTTLTEQNNTVANDGNLMFILENTGASPVTVTFTSIADPFGRTADLAVTVAAGGTGCTGLLPIALFGGSDLAIDASASFADIDMGIYRLKKA